MQETIRVHVVKYRDRPNFVMRYRDPSTGKQVTRSARTTRRRDAVKKAAKWEAELQEGRYQKTSRMEWPAFVSHAEKHYLATLAPRTTDTYGSTLAVFGRECNPHRLADVTTGMVTEFRTKLADKGRSAATIARHMRTLGAVLRWAQRQGLIASLPKCSLPRGSNRGTTMKGRPLVAEEFDRLLASAPLVVGEAKATPWVFFLRVLWASGLRLTEALTLSWDDRPDAIVVDLSGRRPMLRIPAAVEKSKRGTLWPCPPELVELLEAVPREDRHGRVFEVGTDTNQVSRVVSKFGKRAGIIVSPAEGTKGEPGHKAAKFASAHDLRRSFGTRWSRVLSPARLKALMRHSSIATTMTYYVCETSAELADVLWEVTERGPATAETHENQCEQRI